MTPTAIINARRRVAEGLWTIRLQDRRVAALEAQEAELKPAETPEKLGNTTIDARGALVTPSLVDAHVHLDLTYSLDAVPTNQSGTLLEAIRLWEQAKRDVKPETIAERATRAIHDEVRNGTGFLRSHVDVGSSAELRLCQGVQMAREETSRLCKIEVVAFPQDGLIRDPGAVENMRGALRGGADLVGGIPHIERTPREGIRQLEMVFDLAEEFDASIDVHIDETDDPNSMYVENLASLTIQRGWQGRVTASHVCALASYDEVHASRVMDLIAEAGISVVCNPGVNLHLQGRYDRYPKRRGLTRVKDLLCRGVQCATGQDCINDPFYPLGNGKLLDQVFLLVHAEHMGTIDWMHRAFMCVCCTAGEVIGIGCHRLEEKALANLAIFPAENIIDLIRLRPEPRYVLHAGEVVAGTESGKEL